MEDKNFQELILNQLVNMSNQIGELKGEMRQGFKEVKGEIKELREDVDELWEALGKNPPKKEYNKKIIKIKGDFVFK